MNTACKIVALYSYPVKSCRGTPMTSVHLSPQGIEGDRQLVIIRGNKKTNQAQLPKLATIDTRRIDENTIEFRHESVGSLTHAITAEGDEVVIDFYGNAVPVIDQGDAVAELISSGIGENVRVAALKETFPGIVRGRRGPSRGPGPPCGGPTARGPCRRSCPRPRGSPRGSGCRRGSRHRAGAA